MEIKRDLQERELIDHAIAVLNEAYQMDPNAMNELAKTRIICNDKLADHPTIQVGLYGDVCKVGLIGILNGIFGAAPDGWGAIAGDFDVICPIGHSVPDKATVRDKCSVCGESLEIGKLIGFKRIR